MTACRTGARLGRHAFEDKHHGQQAFQLLNVSMVLVSMRLTPVILGS
jgi:hypothetical protein